MKFHRRFTYKFAEWEFALRRDGRTRLADILGWWSKRKVR